MRAGRRGGPVRAGQYSQEGLVAVAPLVVLGADVLVGVLDALLQRGHVAPVLPVLVPEVVGVGGGEDERGDDAAADRVCQFAGWFTMVRAWPDISCLYPKGVVVAY